MNETTYANVREYVNSRDREKEYIKKCIAQNKEIEYSATDSWIKIDGKVFNGFGRKEVEKLSQPEKPVFTREELRSKIIAIDPSISCKLWNCTVARLEEILEELQDGNKE